MQKSLYEDCTPFGVAISSGLAAGEFKSLEEQKDIIPKKEGVVRIDGLENRYREWRRILDYQQQGNTI